MINENLTIIVKTLLRGSCLERLVKSIRRFYQDIPIHIVDGHNYSYELPSYIKNDINIHYFIHNNDIGVSKGRNILLNSVKTPYFITVDDDFVFTEYTRLGSLLNNIMYSDYDILGGLINDRNSMLKFYGDFYINGNTLKYESKFDISTVNIVRCDIIPQFFIARTSKINSFENNWDSFLKIGEHTDFFLRIYKKLKIGYITSCIVNHEPILTHEYRQYRNRGILFKEYVARKHNINKIIEFNNNIWYRNG